MGNGSLLHATAERRRGLAKHRALTKVFCQQIRNPRLKSDMAKLEPAQREGKLGSVRLETIPKTVGRLETGTATFHIVLIRWHDQGR